MGQQYRVSRDREMQAVSRTSLVRNLAGSLCAGVFAMLCATAAHASPWAESHSLDSSLSGPYTYTENGTTGTVVYANQVATNTGSSAAHLGFYFGWNWLYDVAGANTPLTWDNTTQTFHTASFAGGGAASMKITRVGFANEFLRLGDIYGDTWIGVGWAPGGETPIATSGDWVVPLFDFGVIQGGASVNYDIQIDVTFASTDDLAKWQSFYVGAQAVQVPEPDTLALFGIALFAIALRRRQRH